jgi:MFS family permease
MRIKSPNLVQKALLDMADVCRESIGPLRDTARIILLFAACVAPGMFLAGWLKDIFIHQAWYLSGLLPVVGGSLVSFFLFMFVVFFIGNIRERRNRTDEML